MTTSNYITFILLGVIGLVFLIDFILNSRKKPLEKSVEKFVEKETKKKNWITNPKIFVWIYLILIIVPTGEYVAHILGQNGYVAFGNIFYGWWTHALGICFHSFSQANQKALLYGAFALLLILLYFVPI